MGHSLCSELMSFHDWLLSCGCSFACKSTNMTPGAHLAFAVSFSLTPYKLRRAAWKLPPPPRAVTAWICLSVFLASWPAIFLSIYLGIWLPVSLSASVCLPISLSVLQRRQQRLHQAAVRGRASSHELQPVDPRLLLWPEDRPRMNRSSASRVVSVLRCYSNLTEAGTWWVLLKGMKDLQLESCETLKFCPLFFGWIFKTK